MELPKSVLAMRTIFLQIEAERRRQDDKWNTSHPNPDRQLMCVVLTEEVGEVCRAVLDNQHDDYERELIQVAAVAVKMLELLGRE